MKKKTKPATAGERLEMRRRQMTLRQVRSFRDIRENAARTDRAIARAVQKERERCGFVVFVAMCNCESLDWAHQCILHPEKQKP